MTGMILISGHIHASFRKLRFIRKWDQGMAIHPEDKTSYTTQYLVAFLKYVANEYCAKHRRLSVIKPKNIPLNNLFPHQLLVDQVNARLIHMLCPAKRMDTGRLNMGLK